MLEETRGMSAETSAARAEASSTSFVGSWVGLSLSSATRHPLLLDQGVQPVPDTAKAAVHVSWRPSLSLPVTGAQSNYPPRECGDPPPKTALRATECPPEASFRGSS